MSGVDEAIEGHRKRNLTLRQDFERRGVDLVEPRPIDFHFWAWSDRDAAVLAKSLYKMGFLITLLAPAPTDDDAARWPVQGGARIPLAQALGDQLTTKLVRLAAEEGTVFDGWGTSV